MCAFLCVFGAVVVTVIATMIFFIVIVSASLTIMFYRYSVGILT